MERNSPYKCRGARSRTGPERREASGSPGGVEAILTHAQRPAWAGKGRQTVAQFCVDGGEEMREPDPETAQKTNVVGPVERVGDSERPKKCLDGRLIDL